MASERERLPLEEFSQHMDTVLSRKYYPSVAGVLEALRLVLLLIDELLSLADRLHSLCSAKENAHLSPLQTYADEMGEQLRKLLVGFPVCIDDIFLYKFMGSSWSALAALPFQLHPFQILPSKTPSMSMAGQIAVYSSSLIPKLQLALKNLSSETRKHDFIMSKLGRLRRRLFPLFFELRELGQSDKKWSSLKEEIASLREKESILVEDIEAAKNVQVLKSERSLSEEVRRMESALDHFMRPMLAFSRSIKNKAKKVTIMTDDRDGFQDGDLISKVVGILAHGSWMESIGSCEDDVTEMIHGIDVINRLCQSGTMVVPRKLQNLVSEFISNTRWRTEMESLWAQRCDLLTRLHELRDSDSYHRQKVKVNELVSAYEENCSKLEQLLSDFADVTQNKVDLDAAKEEMQHLLSDFSIREAK